MSFSERVVIEVYTWISEGDSKSIVVCKSCKKTIIIASMGEAAITSHAKSEKHQKNLCLK